MDTKPQQIIGDTFPLMPGEAQGEDARCGLPLVAWIVIIAVFSSASLVWSAYKPPSIMAVGDSITRGVNPSRCYRSRLDEYGVRGIQVGTQDNSEGYPGYTIDMVDNAAVPNIKSLRPNVVLLEIGTNDFAANGHANVPETLQRLCRLIADVHGADPDGVIYIATPLQTYSPKENAAAMNAFCEQMPRAIHSLGINQAKFVNLRKLANLSRTDYISDEIYPSASGCDKMARAWALVLKSPTPCDFR